MSALGRLKRGSGSLEPKAPPTGGSIIRPASFCGVYALKPTWGIVGRDGSKTYSTTLDTIGWYGRGAEDLALLYEVFDRQPQAVRPFDLSKARIAVCRTPVWHHAGEATINALSRATAVLREAGAEITELELPAPFEQLIDCQVLIMRSEGQASFLPEYMTALERLHSTLREQVENVDGYTREGLCQAYDTAARCRMAFDPLAAPYDCVRTPSTIGEATLGLAATGEPIFNAMWTLLHVPCLTSSPPSR
ncbi:MAG: amidase family protein [Pigmentiphaga sp.]|nr:amidase family protein [Pigmentiphaga sp.]